jgi:hypothetical protein
VGPSERLFAHFHSLHCILSLVYSRVWVVFRVSTIEGVLGLRKCYQCGGGETLVPGVKHYCYSTRSATFFLAIFFLLSTHLTGGPINLQSCVLNYWLHTDDSYLFLLVDRMLSDDN